MPLCTMLRVIGLLCARLGKISRFTAEDVSVDFHSPGARVSAREHSCVSTNVISKTKSSADVCPQQNSQTLRGTSGVAA